MRLHQSEYEPSCRWPTQARCASPYCKSDNLVRVRGEFCRKCTAEQSREQARLRAAKQRPA